MIFKIKSIGDHVVWKIEALSLLTSYVRLCFWLSWLIPFGAVYVFEIIKAKGWIG